MSEFLTTGVAAPQGPSVPAESNIFSGSQWGGPDSWDGPVWSTKYHKYITQKDADFDEAEEAVAAANKKKQQQQHDGEHSSELHKEICPCSVPSHHASYVIDIKRRVEPMVESITQLEKHVGELLQQVKTNNNNKSNNNSESAPKDEPHHDHHDHLHHTTLEESVSKLKSHVHDIAQKMHSIIMNAEHGVASLGKIDQGSKDEVEHLFRTEASK